MSSWFRFRRQPSQAPPPIQPSVTGASQTEPSAVAASPRRPPFRPAGAAPAQGPPSPSRKPPSRAASRPSTPSRNGKRTPPLSPSRLAALGETSPPQPPPPPPKVESTPPPPPPPKVENIPPPQQPSNERTLEEEPVPMKEREAAPETQTPHAGDVDESKPQPPEMTKQSSETTVPEPIKQSSEILETKMSPETTFIEPPPPPPQISDPLLMVNNKKEEPQPTTTKLSQPEEEKEAAAEQHPQQTIKTVVAETSKDKDDHGHHRGELLAHENRAAGVKEVPVAAINVIITLTGENKGAFMQLGRRPSNEKPIHIHRAYKPSQRLVDHPPEEEEEDMENASYVNSNVQGVNNSILVDSHVREMDPGVSVAGIPHFPAEAQAKQNDQTTLHPRGDVEGSRDGKRRIRRRCLRGLLMEPSDSDSDDNNPEKPRRSRRRRHGCRVACDDVL